MERLSTKLSIDLFGNIQYLAVYRISNSISICCFIHLTTTFHMIAVFMFQVLYRSNWEFPCLYMRNWSHQELYTSTFNHCLSAKLTPLSMFLSVDEDLSLGYGSLMFVLCSELDYTPYKHQTWLICKHLSALLRSPPDPALPMPQFPHLPNPIAKSLINSVSDIQCYVSSPP